MVQTTNQFKLWGGSKLSTSENMDIIHKIKREEYE